jgi:DNA-binding NtrC family response regulator
MDMEMVKCVLVEKGIETNSMARKPASRKDMEDLREQCSPAAFVVQKEELKLLTEFKGLVEDKGTKRKTSGLGKYLLGRKLIPAIDGNYETAGKLKNGVRKLLAGALGDKRRGQDRNIYIVGVSKMVFEQFVYACSASEASLRPAKQARIDQPVMQANVNVYDFKGYYEELRRRVKVPKELESAYVGKDEKVQLVRIYVTLAAPREGKVMILGDSGTGKDVVANWIHRLNPVRFEKGKFVAVNCATIPTELFEYELFGIEGDVIRGVGARVGLWVEANDGTLFLDEFADLHDRHQAKILRALETGKIRRVGGKKDIDVNARVIAATNKDIDSLIKQNRFREDLFYRLNDFIIRTPSLREHPGDVREIALHIWKDVVKDKRQPLSNEILDELNNYTWPGNVRELKGVLFRLHALFDSLTPGAPPPPLTANDLKFVFHYQGQVQQTVQEQTSTETERQNMDSIRHLCRVHEVIRAAEMNVRKLMNSANEGNSPIWQINFDLQHYVSELEFLNLYPRHFQPESYHAVGVLRSKLTFFLGLLKDDVSSAVTDMKVQGLADFEHALERIKAEMKSLVINT